MAQKSRNRFAVVWAMRMGGGNKGMIGSCTHKNEVKEYRVKANMTHRPGAAYGVVEACAGRVEVAQRVCDGGAEGARGVESRQSEGQIVEPRLRRGEERYMNVYSLYT